MMTAPSPQTPGPSRAIMAAILTTSSVKLTRLKRSTPPLTVPPPTTVLTKKSQMQRQFHQCWVSRVIGMPHMQMNWQISESMAMLVKFGKSTSGFCTCGFWMINLFCFLCSWLFSYLYFVR